MGKPPSVASPASVRGQCGRIVAIPKIDPSLRQSSAARSSFDSERRSILEEQVAVEEPDDPSLVVFRPSIEASRMSGLGNFPDGFGRTGGVEICRVEVLATDPAFGVNEECGAGCD